SGLAGLTRRALGCGVDQLTDPDQAARAARLRGGAPRAVLLGLRTGDDPDRLIERARRLGAPVICVLGRSDDVLLRAALRADADGYLLLEAADADTLRETLAAVEAGERVIPPELEGERDVCEVRPIVTVRCLEVLRLLADGHHDDEIAEHLGISTSS